jgi:hypothetical protein
VGKPHGRQTPVAATETTTASADDAAEGRQGCSGQSNGSVASAGIEIEDSAEMIISLSTDEFVALIAHCQSLDVGATLNQILERENHMATQEQFEAIRSQINTATNALADGIAAVAAKLTNLQLKVADAIAKGGMTATVEDTVLTELTQNATDLNTVVAALQAVAADPAPTGGATGDPVPPPPSV